MLIPDLEQQEGPDLSGIIRRAGSLIGLLHLPHLCRVKKVLFPQKLVGKVPAEQIAAVFPHPAGKRDAKPHLFMPDQGFGDFAPEQVFQNPLFLPLSQFELNRKPHIDAKSPGTLTEGEQSFTIGTEGLSKGMYLVNVIIGGYTAVAKMMVR